MLCLGLCLAAGRVPAQEAETTEIETEKTPVMVEPTKGVGYVRVLFNQQISELASIKVETRSSPSDEILYEGPGPLFLGGYLEIPVGRSRVTYTLGDKVVADGEMNVRAQEFYTINLLLPLRGTSLPVEKDGPPDPENLQPRLRVYNFTGDEFRSVLKLGNQKPVEIPQSTLVSLEVPKGKIPLEIAVFKPSTEEYGKIVSEGDFADGTSITMILYKDYRGKVGNKAVLDGVLD